MAGKWHFLVLLLLFVGCVSSGKTSNSPANTDVDFLTQIERPDWKHRIDGGDIGYFNHFENTLIGLDEPPHNKGDSTIQPDLKLSSDCKEYTNKDGEEATELEFVVDKNGELRQFFVLESAGPCDEDVATALKQANLIPAKEDGQNKAALVHLRFVFDQL